MRSVGRQKDIWPTDKDRVVGKTRPNIELSGVQTTKPILTTWWLCVEEEEHSLEVSIYTSSFRHNCTPVC